MQSLIATIEQFDPGHFSRREDILEEMWEKVRALGFFPLPLTRSDIECFWISLEPSNTTHRKSVSMSRETYLDMIEMPSVMQVYKEVARYET